MAEQKTKKTKASVAQFLNSIPNLERRQDSLVLNKLYTRITGKKAAMWGPSIVGYGVFHYQSQRSRQSGDWPRAAFSPRKQTLTLYVDPPMQDPKLFRKLGPHSISRACLYIKRLSDVRLSVLEQIIRASYRYMQKTYPEKK